MMKWTLTTITAWKKFAESDFCQINSVFTSQWAFSCFLLCFEFLHGIKPNRVHCKGEFYIGNIQKLSLAFLHCLCGCWCKGINLWPHQIPAWMIVVCLVEQLCSAILVTKSSVMKSLKNSTGGVECSTKRIEFSNLRPILEELGTTEILLSL